MDGADRRDGVNPDFITGGVRSEGVSLAEEKRATEVTAESESRPELQSSLGWRVPSPPPIMGPARHLQKHGLTEAPSWGGGTLKEVGLEGPDTQQD